MRALVWFRSDLRAQDNTALHEAARRARDGVVGIFIVSPDQWKGHDYAPCRVELILRTLRELSETLGALNIPLLVETAPKAGDVPALIAREASRLKCGAVFANREYEVDESRRDEETARLLAAEGVEFHAFHDQVAIDPASIRTGEGRFYSVFSPFRKAWLTRWKELGGVALLPAPKAQRPTGVSASAVPERVKGFESSVDPALWPGGEMWAGRRLRAFAKEAIGSYKTDRDFPGRTGTSGVSVPLAVGALSTRQCLHAALGAGGVEPGELDAKVFDRMPEGPRHWLSEVVWREFFTHVLVGWPRVCMNRAFQVHTDRLVWSQDRGAFEAWCEGRTGIPLVDAGMRQLAATGWMHNRVRMVTAMFLTKNLFIDWRWGERHFMRHLVDGYFASNNGGWQWSASTGTDAAPYFRIFNPISQSEKFDPDGDYIRRWLPELAGVAGDAIHEPHERLPPLARARLAYPEPIADLSGSRDAAIRAFQALRAPAAPAGGG